MGTIREQFRKTFPGTWEKSMVLPARSSGRVGHDFILILFEVLNYIRKVDREQRAAVSVPGQGKDRKRCQLQDQAGHKSWAFGTQQNLIFYCQ